MKIAFQHLKKYCGLKAEISDISEKLFQLGHEHEIIDEVFDIEFTPNRGDCLSLRGLGRDLKNFYPVSLDKNIYLEELPELEINFTNESVDDCPFISFASIEIEDTCDKYQDYIEDYFETFKLNKNNFFTDISNYLAYEMGQPTHCYDFKKMKGDLKFNNEEINKTMNTLLQKEINLKDKNCFFSLNSEVINLAGVIGDDKTSCKKDTKKILLECAYFKPESIIGKSLQYDIQSEAAYKFERGVDPFIQEYAIRRFLNIVKEHVAIKSASYTSYAFKQKKLKSVTCNHAEINKKINTDLRKKDFESILANLNFGINNKITIPSHRHDIFHANDIAEEVARVVGYNNIKTSPINISIKKKKSPINLKEKAIKNFLINNGFYEAINSSFSSRQEDNSISVDNPLDSYKSYLRNNILDSLIIDLEYNEKRQKDSIKIFEISDVYFFDKSKIQKKRMLGAIVCGRVDKNYEDFSKKLDSNYLENIFKNVNKKFVGEIVKITRSTANTKSKNNIFAIEIPISELTSNGFYLDEDLNNNNQIKHISYKEVSEYPSSSRDISALCSNDEVIPDLEKSVLGYNSEILVNSFIFDYFVNTKTSSFKIGFRFIFQSPIKTLKDKEIDEDMNNIINIISKIQGVKIPGL